MAKVENSTPPANAKHSVNRRTRSSGKRQLKTGKRAQRVEVDSRVLEQQVRICKAFANTTRLQMLDLLGQKEQPVGALAELLGVSKANLSQHLAILKAVGIVETRREGRNIYCFLAIPAVTQACHLIREVLRVQFQNKRALTF
jgi:ArsR family transcriptional regulator